MQRRRDRLEIVLELLEYLHAAGALRKTRLLQLTGLNIRTFNNIIDLLEEHGLISYDGGIGAYRLTKKGVDVLYVLRALSRVGLLRSPEGLDGLGLRPAAPTPSDDRERLGGREEACGGVKLIVSGGDPLLSLISAGVDVVRGLRVVLVDPVVASRLRVVEDGGMCRG